MTDIHLRASLLHDVPTLLQSYTPTMRLSVVSDVNTLDACGWSHSLPFAHIHHHCFDSPPRACLTVAKALDAQLGDCDSIVAIGSGTMNDICKYIAHRRGIPYAVVATAPSMNGYVSPNASLQDGAHKRSIAATAPALLLADIDILAAAPARLIASGIGDSLCRRTVERDLCLSHHYCATPRYSREMARLRDAEANLCAAPPSSPAMINALMQTLIEGGRAMANAGSSAPASQGEHMLAHTLETLYPDISARHYHGEIIAVTTLTMAAIQADIARKGEYIRTLPDFPARLIQHHVDASVCEQWREAYTSKQHAMSMPPPPRHIADTHAEVASLYHLLTNAGCPTTVQALGITPQQYDVALRLAPYSRDRFTYLDMWHKPLSAMTTPIPACPV